MNNVPSSYLDLSERGPVNTNLSTSSQDPQSGLHIPQQYKYFLESSGNLSNFKEISKMSKDMSGKFFYTLSEGNFQIGNFMNGKLEGRGMWKYSNTSRIGFFENGGLVRGIYEVGNQRKIGEFNQRGDLHGFGISSDRNIVIFCNDVAIANVSDVYSLEEQIDIHAYMNSLQLQENFESSERFIQIQQKKQEKIGVYSFSEHLDRLAWGKVLTPEQRDGLERVSVNQALRNIIIPIFLSAESNEQFRSEVTRVLGERKIGGFIFPKDFEQNDYFYEVTHNYLSQRFSFGDLEKLYQKNPKKFLKLQALLGVGFTSEAGTPNGAIVDFIKKYPNISYDEARSFGAITGSGHYRHFSKSQSIGTYFSRILFYNFVKKLPKTTGKVYRGISFDTKEEREKFLQNANSLGNEIQNFSTKKEVAEDFSRGDFSVLIEVESDQIRTIDGELWDMEGHAWFPYGTKFEFISIDRNVWPYKVVARVKN